ncbi:cytochrome P450 monooxygenase [Venturia nashicola]|nr:cytochrome P450 monooxygenase [Venturia nashicola]
MVVFNEDAAFRQLYGPKANVTKSPDRYAATSASRNPNTVSAIHKHDVDVKRRAHAQMWSHANLKQVEPKILPRISTFLDIIGLDERGASPAASEWGAPQDMNWRSIHLVMDITTDLTYSVSAETQTSESNRWIPHAFIVASWRGTAASFQPLLYKLHLDKIFLARAYKQLLQLGLFSSQRQHEWKSPEKSTTGVYQDLTAAMKRNSFSKKDLWVESYLMSGVGKWFQHLRESHSDVHRCDSPRMRLGACICTTCHPPHSIDVDADAELSRHRDQWIYAKQPILLPSPLSDVYKNVVAEVRGKFAEGEDIVLGPDLQSCKYLVACIDETLRLCPVLANALFRKVQPGGQIIDGEIFPEGTDLGASIYAVHMNEKYFPDPHVFDPNRFLGEFERSTGKVPPGYFPFSTGPRACPGFRLVFAKFSLVIARTLFRYDMRLAPDAPCCGSVTDRETCSK